MRTIDADTFDATMYEAWMNCEITNEEWFHFREMIKDEPTIEPQRMRGKWIKTDNGHVEPDAICSRCGFDWMWSDRGYFKFCPNCGSYNGGEQDVNH